MFVFLLHSVPYLSFEVNLPEFKNEGIQCIEILTLLEDKAEFNYTACLSKGLFLEKWLQGSEFLDVYNQCSEKSIEIFWRTGNHIQSN